MKKMSKTQKMAIEGKVTDRVYFRLPYKDKIEFQNKCTSKGYKMQTLCEEWVYSFIKS